METRLNARSDVEAVAKDFVDAALKVHRALGPGLLESAYKACLAHELTLRGRTVQSEVHLPLTYKGLRLETGYRMDLVVDGCLIAELKAVDALLPIHRAQLLTYLRISGLPIAFLLNFHTARLKDGLHRFISRSN